MNPKHRTWLILALILSLLLVACGGQNAQPAAPTEAPAAVIAQPTEMPAPTAAPVVVEPTAEPMAMVADLDQAFADFLGRMVAYNTIGLEDTNVALAEDPPPFLLDVRQPDELEKNGYIEGAVLIPLRELAQNLDLLPAFDTPIIAYCGSGWRATIAMTALDAMGWTDVKVMKGGSFTGWKDAGYPTVEGLPPEGMMLAAASPDAAMVAEMDAMLQAIPEGWGVITNEALNGELIENADLILIDARKVDEVDSQGFIDASNAQVHIPIEQFIADMSLWPADKDDPIVAYCGSGHRSTIAMAILRSYGYTNVRSLKGGFGEWSAAGFPISHAGADLDLAFGDFLASMEGYNTISLEDTNLALAEDPPPFLLDVRQPDELEKNGYIEGAVLIPLRELAQNLDLLPSYDTPIIAYCGSGWRATIAMTALDAMGWTNVKVMKGGSFTGWVEAGYPYLEGLPLEGMVLDVASPDAGLVAAMDAMLRAIPEGWGVVTSEALNTILIETPAVTVIDVRRLEELETPGIIAADNVAHIPLEAFVDEMALWPADKDAPIIIYCGSGHRSTIAMSILYTYGYTDVLSLKGGFGEWKAAGYPVAEFVGP